jgi:peptidoglycan/LPS O-acetylase OafA/YrhL
MVSKVGGGDHLVRLEGADAPIADHSTTARKVDSIQALRAFAACYVVLYHVHIILRRPEYGANNSFAALTLWGWLGVNLFFVISGFTIFYAHSRDIGKPARLGRYTWRRLSRIYPMYWLCLALFMTAAAMGVGATQASPATANVLTSVTLLPFTAYPTLPVKVAWTLVYEMMFYTIFALAIVSRSLARLVWPIWALLIVVVGIAGNDFSLSPFNVYNLYFMVGGIVWWLHTRCPRQALQPLVLATVVTIAAAASITSHTANLESSVPQQLALLTPVGLVVLTCVLVERHGGCWLFTNPVIQLLGAASYSIYLLHSAFLSVFGMVQPRLQHFIPDGVVFWLGFSGAVSCGVATHILVERPLQNWLRN